jgi:hypothetical protein
MNSYYVTHRIYILTNLSWAAIIAFWLSSANAQQIVPPFRQDLVGMATTGTAVITIAGITARPPVQAATFVLRADTQECAPRLFRSCQFTVELLNIRLGSFRIGNVSAQSVEIRNQGPIPITFPGSGIPARTPFTVDTQVRTNRDQLVVGTFASRDVSIGATPEGTGAISVAGTLVGTLAGRQLTATLSIFARPLVNRPPIARATSYQLPNSTCAMVVLDGTATIDPDGNLASLSWFDEDGRSVGQGPIVTVPVVRTGRLLFRLTAADDIGGAATAETTVQVTRSPGECRLAYDDSIQAGNSPALSFTPCFTPGPCPVTKTVTFPLPTPAAVFVRYDLGQSHGCCADHVTGALRVLVNGNEVLRDTIPFFNYGVQPISVSLEDFDYFFPPEVVTGMAPPVSQSDPTNLGPLLNNYKRVDQFSLGILAAGSYAIQLQVGDAGWNSIFEIYEFIQ